MSFCAIHSPQIQGDNGTNNAVIFFNPYPANVEYRVSF